MVWVVLASLTWRWDAIERTHDGQVQDVDEKEANGRAIRLVIIFNGVCFNINRNSLKTETSKK